MKLKKIKSIIVDLKMPTVIKSLNHAWVHAGIVFAYLLSRKRIFS